MKKADSKGVLDFRKLWEGYFLQRVVMDKDKSRKGIVCALNWDTLQLGQPAAGSSYQVAWCDENGRYAIEQCEAYDGPKVAEMATPDFDELPAPATNDPLTMLLVKPLYKADFKMTEQEYANRLHKAGKEYERLGALAAAEAQRVKELIAARKHEKRQQQQEEEEAGEVAAAPAKGKKKKKQQKQSAGTEASAKQTAAKVPKGVAAKGGKAAAPAAAAGPSKAAAAAAGAKKKAPAPPAPAAAAAPAPAKQPAGKKTAAGKAAAGEDAAAAAATAPSAKRKGGAGTAPAAAAKKTRK